MKKWPDKKRRRVEFQVRDLVLVKLLPQQFKAFRKNLPEQPGRMENLVEKPRRMEKLLEKSSSWDILECCGDL
ncbi:hypothetical protein ACOSP7_031952 [Xanthoceras sorbifolium]